MKHITMKSNSIPKIKPKLWIFGLSIVILYFVSGFFTSKLSFFAPTSSLEAKQIYLNNDTAIRSQNQIMWWNFNDNGLTLNYDNFIINNQNIQVYGKKADNSVDKVTIGDATRIGKGFDGSFMTLPTSISSDINGDGAPETVNVAAKADTIYTRGFAAVNTYIEDSRFPFEVVLDGNYDLKVYFNNQLLTNAKVEVTSEDGLNKELVTDSETGEIHIDNMNELRNNINILYSEGNNYYLLSYVVEGHRLLSAEHIKALMNLGIIILMSTVIIIYIIVSKKIRNRSFRGGMKIG